MDEVSAGLNNSSTKWLPGPSTCANALHVAQPCAFVDELCGQLLRLKRRPLTGLTGVSSSTK